SQIVPMAVAPIVRYMILCEDWQIDPGKATRVDIKGLLSNIESMGTPAFPLLYRELCIYIALTECRGSGSANIACVFEETGRKVFETPARPLIFSVDPLSVVAVPLRIRDCRFP